MIGFSLVEFSVRRPRLVVGLAATLTILFLLPFRKISTDTNPKNMLPPTSDVRLSNDEVEKTFGLYEDMIVVGIQNDAGILNEATLGRIQRITEETLTIEGVAARDVSSFTTIDNVTIREGTLTIEPLMPQTPTEVAQIESLREQLFENPLFLGRIISRDARTAAIYVPLEKGANGKAVADRIREIVAKENGPERYYIAGDPVARDTFGAVMFKLMAIFSPIAGLIMFVVMFVMFRNLALPMVMMGAAMISIIWSMGLVIALGFPIHIMSSMSPVFLMAIATDSIHIFNELYFRLREGKDRRVAVLETMQAVSRPVRYTALATAAGFAALMLMSIVPVRVFGGLIAFGTIALRLLSFSFIPAVLMLLDEGRLLGTSTGEDSERGPVARWLRALGGIGAYHPAATVIVAVVLAAGSILGTTRIVVNNNMVKWFKEGSEVRTADAVMNRALGGTSLGYVVAISGSPEEELIKNPAAMRYIEGLQRDLEKLPLVGKTTSVVDYVKRINRVLHGDDPAYDVVPDSKDQIGQYLFLFSMSAKPADLDNVVDSAFQKANIWVQLKSWDAEAMREVIRQMEEYQRSHHAAMTLKPAGIAYFNLVWNDEVLWDMLRGFLLALVVVFGILAINFRSFKWAIVGYTPLLLTVLFIYGAVGLMRKDFDMPISVLSCLSLGMAVDFSIHFINRLRQRVAEGPEPLPEALLWTAARPGRGIIRNALLFALAFSVMIFAPLTPYVTVGAFIASMMMLSALFSIILLPALIVLLRRRLFSSQEGY
ncbi:MAG: MMPL family transporter [Acidobacteriota bacterium]